MLMGMNLLAAYLQRQVVWVYTVKGIKDWVVFLQEPCHEVVFISVITHERLEQPCFGNRD
ncbi:hypothetical protein FXE91_04530 [Vibrio cholerae]|nr:hypothetical protein FXE97_09655 [Vibrio cholerae]TXY21100.1 hypothetical protein FXE92_10205 [Vibrio cholerae]TXY61792.1 hypothetical protein FXE91_04530 [Vibrio cholerae]